MMIDRQKSHVMHAGVVTGSRCESCLVPLPSSSPAPGRKGRQGLQEEEGREGEGIHQSRQGEVSFLSFF